MTTYLDYIRALKSGVVINVVSHNPKLARLETVRHVKTAFVISASGNVYREYSYEAPVITATPAPVLAVVSKPTLLANIRLADKIRYVNGQKIVRVQWSGRAYPVIGMQHGFVLLDTGYGTIGRKPENVRYVDTALREKVAA